jgi:RNA polymerase sigma factor (sigma-70 family)
MSSPLDDRAPGMVVAFNDLIHKVAQSEYSRLPSDRINYNELVYIGAVAVHALVSSNPERELTYSYVATAVRWAIRNELKHRYDWYSLDNKKDDDLYVVDEKQGIREAVYETILSYEDKDADVVMGEESPVQAAEIARTAKDIREAITRLPNQARQVIESRFYKGLKRREIGESRYVSPLRILRMMQASMDAIRSEMQKRNQE